MVGLIPGCLSGVLVPTVDKCIFSRGPSPPTVLTIKCQFYLGYKLPGFTTHHGRSREEGVERSHRGRRGERDMMEYGGVGGRVFDEISFRENFAKLATKRFSCFVKMRDDFREFRSFAKLPRLRKKRFSRNTKIAKMQKT